MAANYRANSKCHCAGVVLGLIGALFWAVLCPSASGDDMIILSKQCPPGFEKVASVCRLRSLYQMYNSLQNQGVGGLKTGLPSYRDGFSPEQIDLGRYLFFDPVLSANQRVACASCHDPDKGFADGLAVSVGVSGKALTRSAPSLWNVALMNRFFWDGRATTLEQQMMGPLYNPDEMATTPARLMRALNAVPTYRRLFAEAFPAQFVADDNRITLSQIYTALAAFESSLISLNSRYDRYAHGDANALDESEIAGLNVFRSFVARCAECHTPPLFSNQQIAVIGTPEPEGMPVDVGAQAVTGDETLRGGFRVPSLRNIALTAPYMHSGRYDSLRDATEFYTLGRGHAVPKGEVRYIHWHIWEPRLSARELDQLVDFMKTLTDERFKPTVPERVPSGLEPVGASSSSIKRG